MPATLTFDPVIIPADLETPTIDLQAASDLGSSSTDDITGDTLPSFTISFPSGLLEDDHIIVQDDEVEVADHTVTALEAGGDPINLGLSALSDGDHPLRIRQERGGETSTETISMGVAFTTVTAFGRSTHEKSAQHFLSVGTSISQIRIWLRRSTTAPADGVQIKIFTTDGSHNPTTTQVGVTSSVVGVASMTTTTSPFDFTFTPPVPVTDAAEYCFVVERTGAIHDTQNFLIARQEPPPDYTDGYYHHWNGTAWVDTLDRDACCIIEQTTTTASDTFSEWSEVLTITIDAAGPTMTSGTTTSVDEGEQLAFALTASEASSFAKTGGVDTAQFAVTGSTLTWVGDGVQDYGTPLDSGANNNYVVEVTPTATLSGAVGTPQSIAVTVDEVGAAYTGPGDHATFTHWWGMRAYSAATIGDPLFRLRNVTTTAQTDISTVTGGYPDTAAITAHLSGAAGQIVKFYDQVGSLDLTETGDVMPLLANANSTYYGVTFSGGAGGGNFNSGATKVTRNQPFSIVTAVKSTATANKGMVSVDAAYAGWIVDANSPSANSVTQYAGTNATTTSALPINTWIAFQFIVNGASSITARNGTESTVNPGAQNITAYSFSWGSSATGAWAGQGLECGMVFGALSGTERTNLNTNMRGAYGGF